MDEPAAEEAAEQRVVVITGGSDGIGAAAARRLARWGDHIALAGRSPDKTAAVAAEIGAEPFVADFADLDQVRALATALRERYPRIDVLVNNAGLIAGAYRIETADGHELTFQVNHLAPFLLTVLLQEPLTAGRATVITTSSRAGAARRATLDLDDLDLTRGYGGFKAYMASKLANVLFTRELARRWGPQGVTAAAVHPGLVRSSWGHSGPPEVRTVVASPARLLMRSPDRGADTIVWLATTTPDQDWPNGGYFSNRKPARPHPLAADEQLAHGLWERSLSLCDL
jgi:NAD(P)-dependent dehydrogenase (short-subunit alcohol dehydrogenase family)